MKQTSILITILSFFLLTACVTKQANETVVTVTIEPQRYFAEKIAGDKFKINCVVPAGQSPETYDPTPQQMIQIGRSIAYLRIGPIGFEQAWMDKIRENNPKLQVFDTSEGMNLLTDTEMTTMHMNMARTIMMPMPERRRITIIMAESIRIYGVRLPELRLLPGIR